jgi:O-antigen/teichoic acid export membrane protein
MSDIAGKIVWVAACGMSAVLFTGIGIYAWRKKSPIHFWAGSSVKSEDVSDIAAYNKDNAIMWITYSLFFWIGGFAGLFNSIVGCIIVAGSVPGLILLVIWYNKIFKKYKTRDAEKRYTN